MAKKVSAHAATFKSVTAVQALETEVGFIEPLAICRVACFAGKTSAAGLVGEHDMISAPYPAHSFADSHHHVGTFVTQHHRATGA